MRLSARALAGLVAFFPAAAASQPPAWLELRSPHFRLVTDASERAGRELLLALEQIRSAFRGLAGPRHDSPLPVRVYLFASGELYLRFQPSAAVRGFYQGGADVNHIVLRASGVETRRIAFHEYAHLVLNHSSARLPLWLEEGIAEFYSTLEFRSGNVIVGRPVTSHLSALRALPWLDAETLTAIRRGSAVLDDATRAGIFYAQSWALVHMLNFSERYRTGLGRLAALLADGEPAADAFQRAFGASLQDALEDLRAYVKLDRWPATEVPFDPSGAAAVSVLPLAADELDSTLLALELELGLWDASEQTLRRLARSRRGGADVEAARAKLAMSRGDFASAGRHFEAAIAAGAREASVYFEYAMLLRDTGEDPARAVQLLERAVELNPNHAEAHFLLGQHAYRHGRLEEAVAHFERAAQILPRQSSFWHALALACHKALRPESALRAAKRALEAAATEQEAEMARAALDLIRRPPAEAAASPPEVVTPRKWFPPQGDRRAEGVLEEIVCQGRQALLRVRSREGSLLLRVENPDRVVLRNSSALSFEFSCGPQQGRPVAVEYLASAASAGESHGTLTAIELR